MRRRMIIKQRFLSQWRLQKLHNKATTATMIIERFTVAIEQCHAVAG